MNKYQESFEHIEMSEEAKSRILRNVNAEFEKGEKRSFTLTKKLLKIVPATALACVALVLCVGLGGLVFGGSKGKSLNPQKSLEKSSIYSAEVFWNATLNKGNPVPSAENGADSKDAIQYSICANNAEFHGFRPKYNPWEALICEGDAVMTFDSLGSLEAFTGLHMPALSDKISVTTGEYILRLNGVASEYCKYGNTEFIILEYPANQTMDAIQDISVPTQTVQTAQGLISVMDANYAKTAGYGLATWSDGVAECILYSKGYFDVAFVLELFGEP